MKELYHTKLDKTFEIPAIESVYYQEFHQNYNRPQHVKHVWQLYFMVQGERHITVDGEPISLKKNDSIFIPPDRERQILDNSVFCDVCCLNFACTSPNPLEDIALRVIPLEMPEREMIMKITHFAVGILASLPENPDYKGMQPRKDVSEATLHALRCYLELFVILLTSRLASDPEPMNLLIGGFEKYHSQIVADIKHYFSENLNRVVTIDELSAHFHLSPTTLKSTFKTATGNTLIHYFNGMKIERARALLQTTDMTVSAISEQLGFCSPTHFSTTFKKYVDMSPQEYVAYCRKLLPHLNRKMRNAT